MTREQFTHHWWSSCCDHNQWYKKQPIALDQAQNFWWFNPWLPNSWQLSLRGFHQIKKFQLDTLVFAHWPTQLLNTGSLLLSISRLQCAWDLDLTLINRRSHVTGLWLLGERENIWMSLCGGNVTQFLNTWQWGD